MSETISSLEQIRRKAKKVDAIDPERIRTMASEFEGAKSRLALQENEIKEIERQAEALRQLDLSIEELETEKRGSKTHTRNLIRQSDAWKSFLHRKKLKNKLSQSLEALCNISGSIDVSLEKLGYKPQEPQKELKELRKKKETYDQKLPLALKKTEYESTPAKNQRRDFYR